MPARGQFVQVTAAAGAASILRAKGVLGANDRINVGLIGCGGRGSAVWQRFLDCVKSRDRPVADVEEGHRTATMCQLGNIATRLGRSLRWDADKDRKPWKL